MSDIATVSPESTAAMGSTSPPTARPHTTTDTRAPGLGGKTQGRGERRRWRLAVLLAVPLAVVLAILFKPTAVPSDFATVERGALEVTLDEEGETRVRDRYSVSAPLAGRVLRIELEPGDPVVAGETVLATFQPTDPGMLDARSQAEGEAQVRSAEAALGQARAELDRAKAELRFAEAELGRTRRLAAENIVSQERLESSELDVDTRREAVAAAEFAVRTARFELERAQARLLHGRRPAAAETSGSQTPIEITSPIDGVVLRRLRESESVVPVGEPLLEVADPARLEIVSDYLSTDAVKIEAGDPVRIEQWGGQGVILGRVRRVEPSGFTKFSALGVEEQRVNVVIDLEDPQEAWEALGDGFRVEVRVVIYENGDALLVPTSALFRHGDGWAAYGVEEGMARLRPVELGRRNGLVAEVAGGLSEGETVLVHPSDAVVDGVRVEERITTSSP